MIGCSVTQPKILQVQDYKMTNGQWQADGKPHDNTFKIVHAYNKHGELQDWVLINGMWRKQGNPYPATNVDTTKVLSKFTWSK